MIKRFIIFVFATGAYSLLQAQQWNRVGTENLNNSGNPWSRDVTALYVWNGKLYVCGTFKNIGIKTANSIASWDDNNWDTLTNGAAEWGNPLSLTSFDNNLIVGGTFQEVGDLIPNTNKIAGWDGQQWFSLSPDNPNGVVKALEYKNKLYVGGSYYMVGQTVVNGIASWDNQNWEDLDGGLTVDAFGCYAMCVYDDKLIAAGSYYNAGSIVAYNIALWDGQDWSDLDVGIDGDVRALTVDTFNNILYAGGSFNYAGGNDGVEAKCIAQWNGAEWSAVGGNWVPYDVISLCMYHGELFVGIYTVTNTQADTVLMKWNGWEWQKVPGLDGNVAALTVYNDELYVGGAFHSCGTDTCHAIARYYAPPDTTLSANKSLIKQTAWLYDNRPNPSTGTTQIPYYLPQGKTGELFIHNTEGKEIKRFTLQSGNNYIELNTRLWHKGVYINTLVWDGWKKQSKRMVVE